jgi:hypothetical protein
VSFFLELMVPAGFTGENTIACTNLCRDEVTVPLKDKIESVFGGSFNINGLGGVLTCGVTGIGAGLSHSPVSVRLPGWAEDLALAHNPCPVGWKVS